MELHHLDFMGTLLNQNVEISTQLTNSVDSYSSPAPIADIQECNGQKHFRFNEPVR